MCKILNFIDIKEGIKQSTLRKGILKKSMVPWKVFQKKKSFWKQVVAVKIISSSLFLSSSDFSKILCFESIEKIVPHYYHYQTEYQPHMRLKYRLSSYVPDALLVDLSKLFGKDEEC